MFVLCRNAKISQMRERVILFLSDGEPSDLPYKIFKLIYDRNKQIYNSVVLLCFALGKSTFGSALQKMASQNFTFDVPCQGTTHLGVMCKLSVTSGNASEPKQQHH